MAVHFFGLYMRLGLGFLAFAGLMLEAFATSGSTLTFLATETTANGLIHTPFPLRRRGAHKKLFIQARSGNAFDVSPTLSGNEGEDAAPLSTVSTIISCARHDCVQVRARSVEGPSLSLLPYLARLRQFLPEATSALLSTPGSRGSTAPPGIPSSLSMLPQLRADYNCPPYTVTNFPGSCPGMNGSGQMTITETWHSTVFVCDATQLSTLGLATVTVSVVVTEQVMMPGASCGTGLRPGYSSSPEAFAIAPMLNSSAFLMRPNVSSIVSNTGVLQATQQSFNLPMGSAAPSPVTPLASQMTSQTSPSTSPSTTAQNTPSISSSLGPESDLLDVEVTTTIFLGPQIRSGVSSALTGLAGQIGSGSGNVVLSQARDPQGLIDSVLSAATALAGVLCEDGVFAEDIRDCLPVTSFSTSAASSTPLLGGAIPADLLSQIISIATSLANTLPGAATNLVDNVAGSANSLPRPAASSVIPPLNDVRSGLLDSVVSVVTNLVVTAPVQITSSLPPGLGALTISSGSLSNAAISAVDGLRNAATSLTGGLPAVLTSISGGGPALTPSLPSGLPSLVSPVTGGPTSASISLGGGILSVVTFPAGGVVTLVSGASPLSSATLASAAPASSLATDVLSAIPFGNGLRNPEGLVRIAAASSSASPADQVQCKDGSFAASALDCPIDAQLAPQTIEPPPSSSTISWPAFTPLHIQWGPA